MLVELKEKLLGAGKEEGCISFTELNKILPDEVNDPADIERVFNFLADHNIEIVTQEGKSGLKRTLSGEEFKLDDDSDIDVQEDAAANAQPDEPHDAEETTTTYLREMGRVDLVNTE